MEKPLPLRALNHISIVVADVEKVAFFYRDVLGFELIQRPRVLEEGFHGAWLHNYNLGVHLIQGKPLERPSEINTKDDHLSFMTDNLADVEQRLTSNEIPYKKTVFVEDGCVVTQLFFHDPEHHMLEICNCDVLPVRPIAELPCRACAQTQSATTTAIAPPACADGLDSEVSSPEARAESHQHASASCGTADAREQQQQHVPSSLLEPELTSAMRLQEAWEAAANQGSALLQSAASKPRLHRVCSFSTFDISPLLAAAGSVGVA